MAFSRVLDLAKNAFSQKRSIEYKAKCNAKCFYSSFDGCSTCTDL